jgi:hypothetical protein
MEEGSQVDRAHRPISPQRRLHPDVNVYDAHKDGHEVVEPFGGGHLPRSSASSPADRPGA